MDQRLDVFPGSTDASRTVAEQHGGVVDATSYGDTDRYTPEDRPANAVDGNLDTAWRVSGSAPLSGRYLKLRPARPVTTDQVTLVQPQTVVRDRFITRVQLRFDRSAPVTVDLGPASLTPEGQVVRFSRRTIARLDVEPLATNWSPAASTVGANPVGFAEVALGGVHVSETIRLPVDLTERVGGRGFHLQVGIGEQRLHHRVVARVVPLDDRSYERINPDLAGRPQLVTGTMQTLFAGMRVAEDRAVRVVVDREQIGSPEQHHRSFALQDDVDRGAQRLGPVFARPERRARPIGRTNKISELASAHEPFVQQFLPSARTSSAFKGASHVPR